MGITLTTAAVVLKVAVEPEETVGHVQRVRFRPTSLKDICEKTAFSRSEVKSIYRGFKEMCPNGTVTIEKFREAFGHFFPTGGNCQYFGYVFNLLDLNGDGIIDFEVRGTAEQKLKFIFDLYDTERTGQLTQTGLERLILSMNDILGIYGRPDCSETSIKRQAEHIFKKFDLNGDKLVTFTEFQHVCLQCPALLESLQVFDTQFSHEWN